MCEQTILNCFRNEGRLKVLFKIGSHESVI